ncbi:MAG: efflux RND transporter periplasmic adaptor subunit [Kofleriaceae bacterium]
MTEKRRRLWPRYLVVALALLLVIAALAGVKVKQIKQLIGFGEAMQAAGPPPESVGSTVAESKTWEATLSAIGSISGAQSVQVAAETPGTVVKVHFDSGDVVKQGQVLVNLDSRTESAQMRALQSRSALAKTTLARTKQLLDVGAIPRAEYDNVANELAGAESALAALRAQIGQKTVRAPFAGRTGIRAINVGQYLAPGTMITTLESQGGMYVDFSLPQEDLATIAVGNKVRIAIRGDAAAIDGAITAVDPTVDAVTRNSKLRAAVGEGGKLRSGMYVTVQVVLPKQDSVVAVPLTSVVRATYGNSVFLIEDGKSPQGQPNKVARQAFVKLGASRGDFVAVLDGLKSGQTIVSEGAFKLRNGAPVVVNNAVKPKSELDPKPENR